jgi:hypothetical protein
MCDDEWMQFCNNNNNEYSTIEEETREGIPICPKAQELYISTKSKIGYLDTPINLADVFWKIPVISYHQYGEGVIKKQIKMTLDDEDDITCKLLKYPVYNIEDISKKKNKIVKKISIGISSKDMVSYRCKKKGAFYNCFVIIMRVLYEGRFKEMHVKLFNTGKMEIPGVPKDDLLDLILDKTMSMLNSLEVGLNINIKKDSFETVLINSNFKCGFNIHREKLVALLKYTYKLCVSYDPCSYPGIMCKFYYYKDKSIEEQDGRLYKQDKDDLQKPMCISFMIFRTGSVLIVGKCEETSTIYDIYEFIKTILTNHYPDIYANTPNSMAKIPLKKKKIKRKKIMIFAS